VRAHVRLDLVNVVHECRRKDDFQFVKHKADWCVDPTESRLGDIAHRLWVVVGEEGKQSREGTQTGGE